MPHTDNATVYLDALLTHLQTSSVWTDQNNGLDWEKPHLDHAGVIEIDTTTVVITACGMTDGDGEAIDIMARLERTAPGMTDWTVRTIRYRVPEDTGAWYIPGAF